MPVTIHTRARAHCTKSCNRTVCNRCQETSIKSRNKMDVVPRAILDHVWWLWSFTYFAVFPDQWLDPTFDNRFITRDLIFTVNYTTGWPSQKKGSFFVLSKRSFSIHSKKDRIDFWKCWVSRFFLMMRKKRLFDFLAFLKNLFFKHG